MQPADFTSLLDAAGIQNAYRPDHMPSWAEPREDIYQGCDGIQFRSPQKDDKSMVDMVRLSDRAFLFASSCSIFRGEQLQRQIFSNSDWVHIQFRLSGGGREQVSKTNLIETPEKSCIIARYPNNSVIDRTSDMTDDWKAACLLVSPKALTDLLDIPAARLPESVLWMALQDQLELKTSTLPMQSAFVATINDIFSCSFQGGIRRAFMRAKSLELLSMVINAVNSASADPERSAVKLSAADLEKLSLSRSFMDENLESTLTLEQLARRVGLNRTKLAVGFKQIYGVSVQAHWRDAKLNRARELLRDGGSRVTEVAFGMGYSDLSSFTRAFSRKFGESPRGCRSGTG